MCGNNPTPVCVGFPHMFGYFHTYVQLNTPVWWKPHRWPLCSMWILAHMCGKNQTCVSCSHYLKLQTLSHIMFLVHKIRNFCPNSFWPICLHNTKIRICLSCEFLLSHSNLSLSAIVMFPCWTWSFLWKTFLRIWHQDTKCKTELYFRTKNKICEATLFWCSKIQRIQIWKSN